MPPSNVLPLVILALILGYMAGIYTAKRFIRKEAEKAANELFNALQEEEKARLQ